MRHYELMVILDPDLEERTVAPSLDQFLGVIRQGGGTVEKVDVWGRRRLAYEIDHKVEGIYADPRRHGRAGQRQGARPPAEPQRSRAAHQGAAAGHEVGAAMAQGDVTITVVGNLTDDPELRFTPSGAAVANFTVASTPRILDKATNEWKDGDALFLRCSVWRQAAENVAESLQRGGRVIVTGRLSSGRTRPRKARSAPSSSSRSTRSARRCGSRPPRSPRPRAAAAVVAAAARTAVPPVGGGAPGQRRPVGDPAAPSGGGFPTSLPSKLRRLPTSLPTIPSC